MFSGTGKTFKSLLRDNDSIGIINSCPGCGRPHTADLVAKIHKLKDLALILLLSLCSL